MVSQVPYQVKKIWVFTLITKLIFPPSLVLSHWKDQTEGWQNLKSNIKYQLDFVNFAVYFLMPVQKYWCPLYFVFYVRQLDKKDNTHKGNSFRTELTVQHI